MSGHSDKIDPGQVADKRDDSHADMPQTSLGVEGSRSLEHSHALHQHEKIC